MTTPAILPFETSRCAMCGQPGTTAETTPAFTFCGGAVTCGQSPHLHRHCLRCGYGWITETVGDREVSTLPTDSQAAMSLVRTLAHDLKAAGAALSEAAITLRDKAQDGAAARRAHTAGRAAIETAASLVDA